MSTWRILHGDCIELLAAMPEASLDACVTDGPYGIGFMGREWDTFKPDTVARVAERLRRKGTDYKVSERWPTKASRTDRQKGGAPLEYDYSVRGLRGFQAFTEQWAREVLRVLKPGGYLLSCGAPRSHHRMMCGLEDAGFEIRDCLAWLFGQGFPKSLNLDGDWQGWGTALKPGHEPIALARKPFKGSVAANVARYGTGALNIDGCRIGYASDADKERAHDNALGPVERYKNTRQIFDGGRANGGFQDTHSDLGRWPANVLLDEIAAKLLDEQSGELTSGEPGCSVARANRGVNTYGVYGAVPLSGYGDTGGASRFFYVAKPDRAERDFGCEALRGRTAGECTDRTEGSAGLKSPRAGAGRTGGGRNFHPTVKPVDLMRYLVRLVTPRGGTVLDPFTGSGTTGMAALYEGFNFIGCEREADYIEIARARIRNVAPLLAEEVTA